MLRLAQTEGWLDWQLDLMRSARMTFFSVEQERAKEIRAAQQASNDQSDQGDQNREVFER